MMKICSICKEKKPLSEFYSQNKYSKKRGHYIYYNPECKECRKDKTVQWQNENPDKLKIIYTRYNNQPHRILAHRENAKRRKLNGSHDEWLKNNPDKTKLYNKNRLHKNHKITSQEWDDCRIYFNFRCAYCGKTWEQNKKETKKDLHKEHVDHYGANDLSNCVPSCRDCNSQKWEFEFEEWYNEKNDVFDKSRYDKIAKWLNEDHKHFINC